jgi:hypothetical protein
MILAHSETVGKIGQSIDLSPDTRSRIKPCETKRNRISLKKQLIRFLFANKIIPNGPASQHQVKWADLSAATPEVATPNGHTLLTQINNISLQILTDLLQIFTFTLKV